MSSSCAERVEIVFKIATEAEWADACTGGAYLGSPDDLRDGFIHLSTGRQLAGTVSKHFRGRTGLILVAFDADRLGAALKWESVRGGNLFPHLYAPIDPSSVLWTKPLPTGDDGLAVIPEGVGEC